MRLAMQVVSGPIVVMAHNIQAILVKALVYYGPGLVDCLAEAVKSARPRLAGRFRGCCSGLSGRFRGCCSGLAGLFRGCYGRGAARTATGVQAAVVSVQVAA